MVRTRGIMLANASGEILQAADECLGCLVLPGSNGTSYPGSYPVSLRSRANQWPPLLITGPHVFWFEKASAKGFDLVGAEQGDSWQIYGFESRLDYVSASKGTRFVVPVQSTTAVPTAAPALSTDGFKVRPSTKGHNFYFPATAGGLINTWVLSAGGIWVDALTSGQIDPTAEGVAYREVGVHGSRIYLRSVGAGSTVAIDAEMEVG